MIAQIVEAYGRYTSSRGPSYSSYQALKAMGLDELEGRLLAGLAGPARRRPTHPGADRQSPCRPEDSAAAAVGGERDQTAHRQQLGREHVQMYGIPQRRRTSNSCAPPVTSCARCGVVRRWPDAGLPAGRPPAAVTAGGDRSAQDAAQVDVHRRVPIDGAQAAAGPPGTGGALRHIRFGGRLQPLHPAAGACAAPTVLPVRVFAFIDTTDEVTHLFGPTPIWPSRFSASPERPGSFTRDGHSDYGNAFVLVHRELPQRALAAQFAAGASATAARITAIPPPMCWPIRSPPAGTRTGSTPNRGTCGQRRFAVPATRTSSPCTSAARPSSSPR